MPVVLPAPIENGDLLDADAVMGHIDALASKFTEGSGGIGDDDFTGDVGRKLDGTKIADSSIPTVALAVEAVTAEKLASDATTPGLDSSRAVSGDHIKNLTPEQFDRIVSDAIIDGSKLKYTVQKIAFSANGSGTFTAVTPTTPIPKASNVLIGAYLITAVPVSQTIWHWHIDDSTANYLGYVNLAIQGGSPSVNGHMVFVSISLT